jgi:PAS domain S-box-containing protein
MSRRILAGKIVAGRLDRICVGLRLEAVGLYWPIKGEPGLLAWERALSHENRFGAALVAEMSDALIYCDAAGTIRIWNRGAIRIFGFSAAEAIGQKLDIIIPANLRERHWLGYRATMETGRTRYADGQLLSVPAVRKDGTRISVEFTIVPFTDKQGQMVGIAAIMRDATKSFEEMRSLRKEIARLQASRPVQTGC